MIKNYFKIAWRSILKSKVTALINIIGLSVGITASVFIMLWVNNELNYDNFKGADNVFRLKTSLKKYGWIWETTPLLLADVAKKEIPEIEKIARLNANNQPVIKFNHNLNYEKKAAYIDNSWFELFPYTFIEGNASSFSQNANGIIITASAAKKYFGNGKPMGGILKIDSVNYEVKGIIKDAPANSSFQYDLYIPLSALLLNEQRKKNDENWGNFNYLTFIKLKSGFNIANTEKKLTKILPENNNEEVTISLISLEAMHLENDLQSSSFVHGNRTTIYIFSALAFLLLLVACINYINLTTAKASMRAKEVSVRKMFGAKRVHLFSQFTAEAFLMSMISLVATLILIRLALPAFNTITDKNFVLTVTSSEIWLVLAVTLFIAFILNSIYPAILLSSFKPLNVFRGYTLLKVKDSFFRKGLVVVQFTISIILISGTILIYRQMNFVRQTNPGYNRSQVISFNLPPAIDRNNNRLINIIKQDLLAQSGIESVTLSNQSILNVGSISTGSADWNGRDTSFNPPIRQLATDADFQKTMQLQMKSGRWFGENVADKSNFVLNESAVNQLHIPLPAIGQRFTFKERTGKIIGIVKDFQYQSMHDKTGPLVAFNDPLWFNLFMVRVAPGNISKAVRTIESTWGKALPGFPLEYSFLDDGFNELYKEDQKASVLILIFAIIAIAISALGLFGLVSFTAEQRIKEIGIRKVLGASVSGIVILLSKDFVKLVLISILIASPLAYWAMHKWIQNFAYRIDLGWWMFALAGIIALLMAIITTSFQAIKAASANPVKSLRTE